jgi:septum formation protein
MDLVLASTSPRRRELLSAAGFRFTVRARPVEEIRRAGEPGRDYVTRLAREKAEAAWEYRDEIVLAADTTVLVRDQILEKPQDRDAAATMIRMLSDAGDHSVLTAICLKHSDGEVVACEETRVHMMGLSEREIEEYVASGEGMDKAGGYGIQGLASKFVDRVDGDYFNVMGLPLALFYKHWKALTLPERVA